MSTLKSYNILLDIENSDRINSELKSISDGFKALKNDASKMDFDNAATSLEKMRKTLVDSAKAGVDVSKQMAAYDKSVKSLTDDLSKQAVVLNHSLSEEGKAQRERLKVLKEKQSLTREEAAEMKRLQKSVVEGTDAEIQAMLRKNKELRVSAKLSTAQLREETRERKTLKTLVKDDLKGLTDRIKRQKEFIASLKTTEGRYKALKKVGSMAVKAGVGIAGVGIAGAGAAFGAAIGAAQGAVDDETALRRMKLSMMMGDRRDILAQLKAKTGADSEAIVAAVNRATAVLKRPTKAEVIGAAFSELKYPGSAALFQASKDQGKSEAEFGKLFNRFRRIESATGVNLDKAIQYARSSSLGGGKWSQSEVVALYASLQGIGAFDGDDAGMDRAIKAFLRKADPAKDFGEQIKAFDWSQYASGAQNKNAVRRGIESIDAGILTQSLKDGAKGARASEAEKTLVEARKLEDLKNKFLVKLLSSGAVSKLLGTLTKWIDDGTIDKLLDGMVTLITWIANGFTTVMNALNKFANKVSAWIDDNPDKEENADAKKSASDNSKDATTVQNSQGGITHGRTLVGERGQELVLPLEPSRQGRTAQIIQNFTQTFNMGSSETTGLSLGQAVKRGSFSQAFLSSRVCDIG